MPREAAAVSAHVLCTPYNHAAVYGVTSFKATYEGCLAVTSARTFGRMTRIFFTCYCGNTGVERMPKQESAQKADPGEEHSPAAPARTRTHDLSITSPAL